MTAVNSCPDKYHLCSIKELYAGAYHVARTQGWYRANTQIWTRKTEKNPVEIDEE